MVEIEEVTKSNEELLVETRELSAPQFEI